MIWYEKLICVQSACFQKGGRGQYLVKVPLVRTSCSSAKVLAPMKIGRADPSLAVLEISSQTCYWASVCEERTYSLPTCRPPGNRDPAPEELQACSGFMDAQISMIQPKVIVTLGRFSFGKFFPGEVISKARGKPRQWRDLTVYPMYHPAAVLYNPKLRSVLEHDFGRLPELIEKTITQSELEQAKVQESVKAQQMTLL